MSAHEMALPGNAGLTVGEALRAFRAANAIPQDETQRATWSYRMGPCRITLPNFAWRKRAVLAHDLHHLATGYPCTIKGECLMAAWECGAGPMPHWAARWMCVLLIPLGLVWAPFETWKAFRYGRRCRSLHGRLQDDAWLTAPIAQLSLRKPQAGRAGALRDGLSLAGLVGWGVLAMIALTLPATLALAAIWLAVL